VYEAEITLPPGIYDVEVTLAGTSASELVPVSPDRITTVGHDTWEGLSLTSAAPFTDTSTAREWHTDPAVEWSRKSTWPEARGDSRLFLFARTLKPEKYKHFSEGLHLLDGGGKLLSDFSTGVEKHSQNGWLAFNADMPAGFYILKRARPGVRARYQPIYLCARWETQVFLPAEKRPFLSTLTLNMAERGAGFNPNDETALAAQVVLDSLASDDDSALVTSDRMSALLQGKFQNPWLGILAAYSLLRSEDRVKRKERSEEATQKRSYLLDHVLGFLGQIGDHPDVRALRLNYSEPASEPFWYPPLLRAGLKRVQQHSTRYAETIPLDSLTDIVLDSLVANSPWTAWRHLDRLPKGGPGTSAPETKGRTQLLMRKEKRHPSYTTEQAPVAEADSAGLEADDAQASPDQNAIDITQSAQNLYGAALVEVSQMAQQAVQSQGIDALQEKVTLDPTRTLEELLGKITAEEVSEAYGLPLARVQHGLGSLRERGQRGLPLTQADAAEQGLTPTEQVILRYATQVGGQSNWEMAQRNIMLQRNIVEADDDFPPPTDSPLAMANGSSDDSASADEPDANTPPTQAPPSLVVGDAAGKLRAEAGRLLGASSDGQDAGARELAQRLRRAADSLLRSAAITVITSPMGRILQPDSAFKLLLAPAEEWDGAGNGTPQEAQQALQARESKIAANTRAWEAALAGASPGRSTVADPLGQGEWELHRTIVEFGTGSDAQAFLNVLHGQGAPQLDQGVLQALEPLLSELAMHTALFAYGSSDGRSRNSQKLQSLVARLEELVPVA
jgi:hypothetical protein